MRRTAIRTARRYLIFTVLFGILSFIGAITVFLFIFAAISTILDVSDGILSAMSGAALLAGCFTASFVTAKRRKKKGLLTGLVCGAAVFAIVLFAGIIFAQSLSFCGIIAKMLMILSCSGIGGIIGVNSGSRFR